MVNGGIGEGGLGEADVPGADGGEVVGTVATGVAVGEVVARALGDGEGAAGGEETFFPAFGFVTDGADVEAIEEILTETGGAEDADIGTEGFGGAEGAVFPFLEEAKEFGLGEEREGVDFIEEERAAFLLRDRTIRFR